MEKIEFTQTWEGCQHQVVVLLVEKLGQEASVCFPDDVDGSGSSKVTCKFFCNFLRKMTGSVSLPASFPSTNHNKA
jgi:hypothetical protein